MTIANS
jgi:hypothetical protein